MYVRTYVYTDTAEVSTRVRMYVGCVLTLLRSALVYACMWVVY